MTRTDTVVVGTLVALLALIAGLIGGPAIQLAAAPSAPSPSAALGPSFEVRPYVEGILGRPSSVSPLTARTQADLIYRRELEGFDTTITLTREPWAGRTGRVDRELLEEVAWPATDHPLVYVCGPTGFVEAVADALVALGHDASRVRTERFGPT